MAIILTPPLDIVRRGEDGKFISVFPPLSRHPLRGCNPLTCNICTAEYKLTRSKYRTALILICARRHDSIFCDIGNEWRRWDTGNGAATQAYGPRKKRK
jgi:hypothetical protein